MSNVEASKTGRRREAGVLCRLVAGFGMQLAAMARAVAATCAAGRSERVLAAMSDYQLKDLGLERGQLARALRC
jgi:uncharacterized protein YjiS (DUF1127 family)